MALWGRQNDDRELPEELRGRDPKDVAAALRKSQENETALAEALRKTKELEDAQTLHTTEFETMKTKLQQLEASRAPEPEIIPDEPPSPWTDPEKFVDSRLTATQMVAMNSGMMTAKMYFQQQLSARDVKIFKKYEKEVQDGVNTFVPMARTMPQSWLNMFLYVKGLHEQDIQKAESSSSDFFSESPTRGGDDIPAPEDKLTAEEEATCNAMHWDKVGYLKRRKEMNVAMSDKGAYARFPVPKSPARSA